MADNDRRDIIISFRATLAEAAHLDAAGQALNKPRARADFARAAALHAAKARVPEPPKAIRRPGRRKPTYDTELLAKILGQLGKIGSNVNQLAKAANGGGAIPSSPAFVRMSVDINEMRNAVSQALNGGGLPDDGGSDDHQG